MWDARMKINALATTVIAAGALTFASSGAIAQKATTSDYDAVNHLECTGTWPDVECEITGVDCLPTCYTGFCCNLPE